MSTWSIVTTTNATPLLIKSFIAYHLSIGVDTLYIYIDMPTSASTWEFLKKSPRTRVTICDEAYWKNSDRGTRPNDHRQRQVHNANNAKKICKTEWIAHIDIDEFIYSPIGISNLLSGAKGNSVLLSVAEVFYRTKPFSVRDVLSAPFHRPIPKSDPELSSQMSPALKRSLNHGMIGHRAGKVFCRTSARESLRIHRTSGDNPEHSGACILHFFAFGYSDWCRKHLRRLTPERLNAIPEKKRQQHLLFLRRARRGDKQVRSLFSEVCIYQQQFVSLLAKKKLLFDVDLRLEHLVNDLFGPCDTEFSEHLPELPFEELRSILASMKLPDSINRLSPAEQSGEPKERRSKAHAYSLERRERKTKKVNQLRSMSITGNQVFSLDEVHHSPTAHNLSIKPIGKSPFLSEAGSSRLFSGDDQMFKSALSSSKYYGEYGCGASTIWVARNTSCKIVSVDSSTEWIDHVNQHIGDRHETEIYFANVGQIGKWGRPVGYERAMNFPTYTDWIWLRHDKPDTVLVDGRFRVCCFLTSLRQADEGTTIIFDDYKGRRHYHYVEQFIKPAEYCGRQARFLVPKKSQLDLSRLEKSIEHFRYVLD